MNASDLFVECLRAEGVTRIYALPGEENADMMLALEGSGIEVILTRHEQGAAFMAAAEGRLTGRPGVCLGTLGPGATNLLTGVADGNMDHAPLVVITGQAATTRQHKESHQVMDVPAMFAPVTKWTRSIVNPSTIPEVIRRAFRIATAERPGAVHLELPEDVAGAEIEDTPLRPVAHVPTAAAQAQIDAAARALGKAARPLIIAGNGVIRGKATPALRGFCEATGIGALMTFMAKGALDWDDPLCLFTIGMGQRDLAQLAVEDADLVLCIGYDLVEYPPESWNPGGDTEVIHIGATAAEVDRGYQPCAEVVGDIADALDRLRAALGEAGMPEYDLSSQAKLRRRMWDEIEAHSDDDGSGPIRPQKLVWDLMQVLDDDALLFCGVGAHKMWVARQFQARQPGTVHISNGFCSMGGALPSAIAAAECCADRQVIAVAGDGDALMNVQEMETAARRGSDIVLMVWEDNGYGLISWKQEQEFGRHTDLSFGNPDWVGLAQSFGWNASRCEGADGVAEALRKALAQGGPTLLVVPVDYAENMKLTERLGEITCRI